MATAASAVRSVRQAAGTARSRDATRMAVAVLGTLVGLAAVEHGVGEIRQGPVPPEALLIESWPDAAAMEILAGEPAATVIPSLLLTGLLAVAAGLAFAGWSIWFAARRRGGLVLIGLAAVLLLVGGGLAPPVMGVALGAVATRMRVALPPPGRVGRAIGPLWPWFLGAAVVGYLGLMPGMVLASSRGLESAALVAGLAAFAFANFALALAAARAHDRRRAQERVR
jgi:hypothetical protein